MEPRLVCFARDALARIQARIRASSAIWVDASLLRTLFMHDMYTLFDPHERCEIGRSHQSSSSLPCIQALVCGTIDLEQCLGGVGPQNNRVITNRLPVLLTRCRGGSTSVTSDRGLGISGGIALRPLRGVRGSHGTVFGRPLAARALASGVLASIVSCRARDCASTDVLGFSINVR